MTCNIGFDRSPHALKTPPEGRYALYWEESYLSAHYKPYAGEMDNDVLTSFTRR